MLDVDVPWVAKWYLSRTGGLDTFITTAPTGSKIHCYFQGASQQGDGKSTNKQVN